MDRHTALLAALALATACATGRPQSEATPVTAGGGTPSARLHALADEMWDTTLAVSPTIGTFLGLPGARHDRMDDNSLETVRRLQDRRDAWWARLQGLPTETFNGTRSEEHTSELQSRGHLVCRLLLEKKQFEPRCSIH